MFGKKEKILVHHYKVESISQLIAHSAQEQGYCGYWGFLKFILKNIWSFYLNLLAMVMPFSNLRVVLHRARGVKIGKDVMIGFNVTIDLFYPQYITIEDGVAIAGHNLIIAHSRPPEYHKNHFESYIAPVSIRKNAWITVGVTVLAGVIIGEGSVISAGSIVQNDIPPYSIAAGNPAKVVHQFKKEG